MSDEVIDRLLSEVRQKNVQLEEIRAEVLRAGRDYERLTTVGAIKNLRLKLDEVEKENRKLKEELYRETHRS